MPSVVIIHAAEDTLPARALAEKLRQAQVQVILEKQPGEELRNAVKGAAATIALWSPRSVQNAELAEEVKFARGKSNVFHAIMQSATAPQQFSGDKSVNLTGWRGEDEFQPWRDLAKMVTDKVGVAPLPPPAPKPPSGFFQPGRPGDGGAAAPQAPQGRAPQPQQRAQQQQQRAPQAAPQRQQAPRPQPAPQRSASHADAEPKKGGGMLVIASVVFVLVAALGGGGFYYMQQQGANTTSAAWEAIDSTDADALRAFLDGDPGEHRQEAEQALADLEERSYEAASDSDTIEAFEAFLNDFPDSQHATRARGRIAELRTMTPATDGVAATTEVPLGPETDPDLLPPGATTTPAPTPDTTGGPQQITPPSEENVPPADQPTN
jgi:hypothetical protein